METQDQQENATTQMIFDSIAVLRKEMNTGLSKIQTDMDIFRNDVKVEIQSLKTTVTDVERSLESIWAKLDESDERLKKKIPKFCKRKLRNFVKH